jgi:16S rRNA (guanine966-N2)-methyltransferase
MRIVGGRLGGRRLSAPIAKGTRPTAERVREAIASLLDARGAIAAARVLDLYAGTGALGFEMVSRGAERLVLVEKDSTMFSFLKQSARELGVGEQVEVLRVDATRAAGHREILARGPYTLVLADPPYKDADAAVAALAELARGGLLADGALLLLETSAKSVPELPESFLVLSRYRYGDTAVALFCARGGDQQ